MFFNLIQVSKVAQQLMYNKTVYCYRDIGVYVLKTVLEDCDCNKNNGENLYILHDWQLVNHSVFIRKAIVFIRFCALWKLFKLNWDIGEPCLIFLGRLFSNKKRNPWLWNASSFVFIWSIFIWSTFRQISIPRPESNANLKFHYSRICGYKV